MKKKKFFDPLIDHQNRIIRIIPQKNERSPFMTFFKPKGTKILSTTEILIDTNLLGNLN